MTVNIPVPVFQTPSGKLTCIQFDPIQLCAWFDGHRCTYGDMAIPLEFRTNKGREYPIPYESCPIRRAVEAKEKNKFSTISLASDK